MKYVVSYIGNYFAFDGKRYDELFDNERLFDTLSIIKQNETPVQWAIRVRVPLQNLLNAGKFSIYHQLCLFASFGKVIGIKTDFGKARIIQRAWRNYKNRPESLATQVWNALKTDDYPNDKKFLGITPQKVNRPFGYDYIDYKSKRLSWHSNSPKLWAESKKSLLTYRLYDYVVNLLQQNGYRLIGGRSWYVMLQWVENPDQYLNNGCRDFVRI
nr:12373_t:CDS:2 [Entrophospora candida]